MSRILAITNQKGGVGKTTTSVNLGAALAAAGRSVLLVDLDPQGNATMGSGADKRKVHPTVAEVLLGEAEAAAAVLRLPAAGYSLLAANGALTVAEVRLMEIEGREYRLREALAGISAQFDYVLIDGPPALNALTINALVAADGVIIPMQCEYYALEGLSALTETIDSIRAFANPKLRTMFDPRNNLANDVSAQLIAHFGEQVLGTVIPRNVRLAEAPSHGLSVLNYDKTSRGALAYQALAAEIMARDERLFAQAH